ncbi:MAG: DUF5703 domain-containing protein [Kiritimatiellae bacterium]|nr:DUF5703 domain-containing protein [Kiritimatiellia bacterium]
MRDEQDLYSVTLEAPGTGCLDSMPIGNGDIGASVWAEAGGDLLFYVSKTDAYDDNNRLLKLGRIRLRFSPNPFVPGLPFRQQLKMREGEIEIRATGLRIRLWVDANRPTIWVEAHAGQPVAVEAVVEIWREEERTLAPDEHTHSDAWRPLTQYPDRVLDAPGNCAVWCHRNEHSLWPATMKHQGLGALMADMTDPLQSCVFGAAMEGAGFVKNGSRALASPPGRDHVLRVHALTRQPATVEAWALELDGQVAEARAVSVAAAREAHRAWWRDFWNRSWIHVTESARTRRPAVAAIPLRIGADATGGRCFSGTIARARLWSHALSSRDITELTRRGKWSDPPECDGLVADWTFAAAEAGVCLNRAGGGLPARIVGEAAVIATDGGKALELNGKGFLEVADDPALCLAGGFTAELWLRADPIGFNGVRLMDKSNSAAGEGFCLDTYPWGTLRSLVRSERPVGERFPPCPRLHVVSALGTKLPTGQWTHVAATFDARDGAHRIYLNGVRVAEQSRAVDAGARGVSRGYAWQRYLMACGGRGNAWAKFNGSIFTLPWSPERHPDYRTWGGAQWFQNARLLYWPLLAAGDFEMLQPFFRTYREALALARQRTRLYYGHAGAFFSETMCFWGTYTDGDYGIDRTGRPDGFATNPYITYYWQGGIELSAMMLEHYAHTGDEDFLRETALPVIVEVMRFYAQHWPRDAKGKIRFAPAAALETWQKVVNPLPEIAGLQFVIGRLLALPETLTRAEDRQEWERLLVALPPLPVKEADGHAVLAAAAEILEEARNSENPELYAVFPYRLYGVGKPDLDVGRETLARRRIRFNYCWSQDPIQTAYLGLASQAREQVEERFAGWQHDLRVMLALWGCGNDETPDLDHGGGGQIALQAMLLQCEGRKMILFPAWPKEWDVEFKLHAPFQTTVEGVLRGGTLERLTVTPPERRRDLVKGGRACSCP